MNITEAVSIVKEEQSVFDDVNTAQEAVNHVLNTMVTQEETKARGFVPIGAWELDGPDPDHPQFDDGYYAHKMVIEWYRLDITLFDYLGLAIDREVGDGLESVKDGVDAGLYAGLRAMRMILNDDEADEDAEVPASKWAEWLGDSDPAMAIDMGTEG